MTSRSYGVFGVLVVVFLSGVFIADHSSASNESVRATCAYLRIVPGNLDTDPGIFRHASDGFQTDDSIPAQFGETDAPIETKTCHPILEPELLKEGE